LAPPGWPKQRDIMTKAIAELVWFLGLVGWYIIRHPFERRARKIRVRTSLLDWREHALLAAAVLGLLVIPAVYAVSGFPAAFDRPFSPAAAWLGLAPLIGALWLFRRSHADLGRNWSITLQMRDAHALVKSGVYRLIRHPMYSSFFLLGIAQVLLLPNWFAGIAGPVGAGILYGFRVGREERMMLEFFGDEYRAYMAGTKRIVPWIL
jgi:protein-S-isoprenylcysteine O-methyltransferase Ste14